MGPNPTLLSLKSNLQLPVSGCAQRMYVKPGGTAETFETDKFDCETGSHDVWRIREYGSRACHHGAWRYGPMSSNKGLASTGAVIHQSPIPVEFY